MRREYELQMTEEYDDVIKQLHQNDEKIDEVSKMLVVLKHEYRSTRDKVIRKEVKEKGDTTQKKMDKLEKKRREIVEKKNEMEFKRKWKGWDAYKVK